LLLLFVLRCERFGREMGAELAGERRRSLEFCLLSIFVHTWRSVVEDRCGVVQEDSVICFVFFFRFSRREGKSFVCFLKPCEAALVQRRRRRRRRK
jgi:hypothetical protein